MEYLDGFEDGYPLYSYTRDGSYNPPVIFHRRFNPMMPMVMIPTFGRVAWWTIEEAHNIFPEETIQSATSKPFL